MSKKLNRTQKTEIKNTNISSFQNGIFQKFTIKEIVFLAILSAVLILTCSIMAVVAEATKVVWAVGQVATALQMSLFLTIGLMRVRKTFSASFILIFMGVIMFMMSPVMGLSNIFVLICIELLVLIIFKGYESDKAAMFAGFVAPILSIITPAVYNSILVPEVFSATISNPIMVVGMTLLVVALSFIGSFVGLKIGKELQKSGVMKNG
ncbi:MAG: hypothetical protein R3Y33_03680 [Clostridia bacterium]